jgi:outer membrane protein TolC
LGPGYSARVRVGLTQPLMRGFGRRINLAQLDNARLDQTLSLRKRDRILSEIARDVLKAYWELWVAERQLAIELESRKAAALLRDDAVLRERTGSLAPADVLSFEVRLASAEEAVVTADATLRTRAMELLRLTGKTSAPSTSTEPGVVPLPSGDLVALALEASSDVREQQAQLEIARLTAQNASDPARARLDLDAYVEAQGLGNDEVSPALSQLGKLDALSAHVGITYEQPLSRRRERALGASARASAGTLQETLEVLRAQLRASVETQIATFRAAEQRIELAERTVALSLAQRDAQSARWKSGSGRALDVVVAEEDVRSAQLRLLRARADLVESHVMLQHMTGRLVTSIAPDVP